MWQPYFLLSTVAATLPRSQPYWKCMKMMILFVCVRNACSSFTSDQRGPVSNAGPLGSQRSHHTTPRGNKVCLRVCARAREGVGVAGVFCTSPRICVCIHFHAVNTCVFFCVICGSAEVATLQWASQRRPLQRGPSVARPRRPLTAHLSLFT